MARRPELPTERLIDMHQIVPTLEGIEELQLATMDGYGIERALLQSVPKGVTTLRGNRDLLALQARHPDRFWASAFLDPRHPRARRRLRQYAGLGVRVIKLLPCLGYSPDSWLWRRFWKTLDDLEFVVMIHTGFITARHKKEEQRAGVFMSSKFGQPILFDRLARQYEGVQFILCHLGGTLWYEQAVEMINQHDNVWADVSGSGLLALERVVRQGIAVRWDKLFWGNDDAPWHYPYGLRLLRHHMSSPLLGQELTPVLHDNAERFAASFLDPDRSPEQHG